MLRVYLIVALSVGIGLGIAISFFAFPRIEQPRKGVEEPPKPIDKTAPEAKDTVELGKLKDALAALKDLRGDVETIFDSSKAVGLGVWNKGSDVQIRIDEVRIKKVTIDDPADKKQSKDDVLVIRYTINNNSTTRKIDYFRPWGNDVNLTDEHNNKYRRITDGDLRSSATIDGLNWHAILYPGNSHVDLMCFEIPVDSTKELRLQLKPSWSESKQPFFFAMPSSSWAKKQ